MKASLKEAPQKLKFDLIRAQDPGHSPNFDSSSSSSSIFCPNPLTFLFPHRLKYGAFSEGLAFTSAAGDSSKTSKIHGRIYKNCAFKMSYILYLPLHVQHTMYQSKTRRSQVKSVLKGIININNGFFHIKYFSGLSVTYI